MILFLLIHFETGFDSFHKNKEDIYRVVTTTKYATGLEYTSGTNFPCAAALRADYSQSQLPSVAATFLSYGEKVIVPGPNNEIFKKLTEDKVFFVEPQFFDIFDFRLLTPGDGRLLDAPYTAFLSRSTAGRYFGDWRMAAGKTLNIYDKPVTIVGILEDAPKNTDFPMNFVLSYSTLKSGGFANRMNDWVNINTSNNCYVRLSRQYSAESFKASLPAFVKKYKNADNVKAGLMIQPLKDVHSDERFENYSGYTFSNKLVNVLVLIGVFLLIVACVNFINLTTAQSVNRSREIGIRKVLGSRRMQLFWQFMMETGLTTFFALFIAFAIAAAAVPYVNQLLSLELAFSGFFAPSFLVFALCVFVLTTGLSGFYPSLLLSGFNPIKALKNKKASRSHRGVSLRRILVVMQFSIAQTLIICVLVVISQMDYFQHADLGFQKSGIVNFWIPGDSLSRSKISFFRNELTGIRGVEEVSYSATRPADANFSTSGFWFNGSAKKTDFAAYLKWGDTAYFRLYNLPLVAGRYYYPDDTIKEYVVNETLVKDLGLQRPEDALGKTINLENKHFGQIVGVIKDFHVSSLKDPVRAVLMSTWKDRYGVANIKLRSENIGQTLADIKNAWSRTFPGLDFSYSFLDKSIENFYWQENQLSKIYKIFAAIAILISCLGLYGFVTFMALQKTKEISVRKVLGASAGSIVILMSKEFTILVLMAFAIAVPIAYYFMHQWLQGYAYRIHLGIGIFLLALVTSIVIAWITIGYQSIKSAVANPTGGLKAE